MRFRAEQHLRRQRDFRMAREQGRRIECGGFTLWYVARERERDPQTLSLESPRVGVVASTAAVGCAIQRNRAKRRLREVFRHHQANVPAQLDLLLIARRSLNQLPYAEIEKKFLEACTRLPRKTEGTS
jgi:ribonuclease P protein component